MISAFRTFAYAHDPPFTTVPARVGTLHTSGTTAYIADTRRHGLRSVHTWSVTRRCCRWYASTITLDVENAQSTVGGYLTPGTLTVAPLVTSTAAHAVVLTDNRLFVAGDTSVEVVNLEDSSFDGVTVWAEPGVKAMAVDGDTLITLAGGSLAIIDISSLDKPVLLRRIPFVSAFDADDGILLLGQEGPYSDVSIIDLTSPQAATLWTDRLEHEVLAVSIEGSVAAVFTVDDGIHSSESYRMYGFNLSIRGAPTFSWTNVGLSYDLEGPHDVATDGRDAYGIDEVRGYLADLTVPSDPQHRFGGLQAGRAIHIEGSSLLVADAHDPILHRAAIGAGVEPSRYALPARGLDVVERADTAYVATLVGIVVVDLTMPSAARGDGYETDGTRLVADGRYAWVVESTPLLPARITLIDLLEEGGPAFVSDRQVSFDHRFPVADIHARNGIAWYQIAGGYFDIPGWDSSYASPGATSLHTVQRLGLHNGTWWFLPEGQEIRPFQFVDGEPIEWFATRLSEPVIDFAVAAEHVLISDRTGVYVRPVQGPGQLGSAVNINAPGDTLALEAKGDRGFVLGSTGDGYALTTVFLSGVPHATATTYIDEAESPRSLSAFAGLAYVFFSTHMKVYDTTSEAPRLIGLVEPGAVTSVGVARLAGGRVVFERHPIAAQPVAGEPSKLSLPPLTPGPYSLHVTDGSITAVAPDPILAHPDQDGDGRYDDTDDDADGDGVANSDDGAPLDPTDLSDRDGDGIGDSRDLFPDDAGRSFDSDLDGIADVEDEDIDGDMIPNPEDAFPSDPAESADQDGDGVGDNADVFPTDPGESADSDGDGVGDNADAFPQDRNESHDLDLDGIGDNADLDDDGDGADDLHDSEPRNPLVRPLVVSALEPGDPVATTYLFEVLGGGFRKNLRVLMIPNDLAPRSLSALDAEDIVMLSNTFDRRIIAIVDGVVQDFIATNADVSEFAPSEHRLRHVFFRDYEVRGDTGEIVISANDTETALSLNDAYPSTVMPIGDYLVVGNVFGFYKLVYVADPTEPRIRDSRDLDRFSQPSPMDHSRFCVSDSRMRRNDPTRIDIYDVSAGAFDQIHETEVGPIRSLGGASSMCIVALEDGSLTFIDLRAGQATVQEGIYPGTSAQPVIDIATLPNGLLLVAYADRLDVLDVKAPDSLDTVFSIPVGGNIRRMVAGDQVAVLALEGGGIVEVALPRWAEVQAFTAVRATLSAPPGATGVFSVLIQDDDAWVRLDGTLMPMGDPDGDGLHNLIDTDDDGDGVEDHKDQYPLNAAESADYDGDGFADNADMDDDGDGVPDADDAFPRNQYRSAAESPLGRLANLSTRGFVGFGDEVLIGGFVLHERKTVVLRARGPSLAEFVEDSITAPLLELFTVNGTLIHSAEGWSGPAERPPEIPADFTDVLHESDTAMMITLEPGSYTPTVSNLSGRTGLGIVEIFELDETATLRNVSTRGRAGVGDYVLIAGFIIVGDAPQTVLIRGMGPSLEFQVPGAMGDPKLRVIDATGAEIAANDDWTTANLATIPISMRPAHAREAALLLTLPPGAYTALMGAADFEPGIGLVEVFNANDWVE